MEIPSDTLADVILEFFQSIPNSGIVDKTDLDRIGRLVDNVYQSVTKKEVLNILSTNPAMLLHSGAHGSSELTDCDDYALQLKASLTMLYRNKLLTGTEIVFPPAVGIVLTQNHALNLVVCEDESRNLGLAALLIDASLPGATFATDSASAQRVLLTLPVTLIYL